MTVAVAADRTVPAFPLGRPIDGQDRYGMTPGMAAVYRHLVKYKPHNEPFGLNFRETAWRMARHQGTFYITVQGLVERGWLHKNDNENHLAVTYEFVHPVMTFRVACNG